MKVQYTDNVFKKTIKRVYNFLFNKKKNDNNDLLVSSQISVITTKPITNMKSFNVNCVFGQESRPYILHIGQPESSHHPLYHQYNWLQKERGGIIPQGFMDAIGYLHDLSKNEDCTLSSLCMISLIQGSKSINKVTESKGNTDEKINEIFKTLDVNEKKTVEHIFKNLNEAAPKEFNELFNTLQEATQTKVIDFLREMKEQTSRSVIINSASTFIIPSGRKYERYQITPIRDKGR